MKKQVKASSYTTSRGTTPDQIGAACEKVVRKQARYRYVIDMTKA